MSLEELKEELERLKAENKAAEEEKKIRKQLEEEKRKKFERSGFGQILKGFK